MRRTGRTGGTEAYGCIRVIYGLGYDCDAAQHQALEFLADDVGVFPTVAGELFSKETVFEPAAQGPFADAGGAGGLDHGGGGGDDGKGRLLVGGEANPTLFRGNVDYLIFAAISGPFPAVAAGLPGRGRTQGNCGRAGKAGGRRGLQTSIITLPQWLYGFGSGRGGTL